MAEITKLTIKGAASSAAAWFAPGDAEFTVPLTESDHRAILLIDNRDTTTVRARVKAGDMGRQCLGDLDVDIATLNLCSIPFTDSMRHKVNATGAVTVQLLDTAGTAITAGVWANVKAKLIQG